MFGTIRKHSAGMWWVIVIVMAISLVWWGATPGTRTGGQRNAGLGTLYGQPVTLDDYQKAEREFYIYYWRRTGEFPGRNNNLTAKDLQRETYVRLLLTAKARQMGIHVSEEAQQDWALQFLKGLAQGGRVPTLSDFSEHILKPAGLTMDDFQRFVVDDMIIDQLGQTLGLPGALVPPQEAAQLYDKDHQEVSAQAVFFLGTNYLSKVPLGVADVAQFYTNYMSYYRMPDRVQINYLAYDLTNYEAAVDKTNLAAQVEQAYAQHAKELAPDAKTPEEARAKIREMAMRQDAALLAANDAKDFLRELFKQENPKAQDLVALAGKKGLKVQVTRPFTEADGPEEFAAPTDLTRKAFLLSEESPFITTPIAGAEAVYVVALAGRVPSEVPPLAEIHSKVLHDYQNHHAAVLAREAGTNFYYSVAVQMAAGKSFGAAALANGQAPVALKPFSLSTQGMPEIEDQATVNDIKNAAFSTQPGHLSAFQPTAAGGFVLYVQSLLPLDESQRKSELPRFLTQVRRTRENEAFNLWLQAEAGRELMNTPLAEELKGKTPSGK